MLKPFEKIKSKYFERWIPGYLAHVRRNAFAPRPPGTRHVLFAVCDHYEPLWAGAGLEVGTARVERWRDAYPKLVEPFVDADGRRPQHSFFFPGEEYRPVFFDLLEELVRARLGEVELHLHHDGETAETLTRSINTYLDWYGQRGHLARDATGRLRYGFIHGNWALANARPDGRWCGVDDELQVLFDTGCYADYTFPSVPDVSQPGIVNQIYWPTGDLSRRRAYEQGVEAHVGQSFSDRIMMIQGPLALARREGRLGGRIEHGALTDKDPVTPRRVSNWVRQNIHVCGRPEWVFVKVYMHGAPEAQAAAYLGESGRVLHETLCSEFNDGERFKLHYVTAREMYNIALAAMAGRDGDPGQYRDYQLGPPPILRDAHGTGA